MCGFADVRMIDRTCTQHLFLNLIVKIIRDKNVRLNLGSQFAHPHPDSHRDKSAHLYQSLEISMILSLFPPLLVQI